MITRNFSKKYNTMFDIAFSIDHDCIDPYDIPFEELVAALMWRVGDIIQEKNKEAFGVCDTTEGVRK